MRTDFGAAGHGGFDCNHIYIFSMEHHSRTQQSKLFYVHNCSMNILINGNTQLLNEFVYEWYLFILLLFFIKIILVIFVKFLCGTDVKKQAIRYINFDQ